MHNKIAENDSIEVINAKLKTSVYEGFTAEQIINELKECGCPLNEDIYEVKNGQITLK